MKRGSLFLDTGVLLGAVLPEDARHEKAAAILDEAPSWRSLHTSDAVIAEGLNFIRQKIKRRDAAEKFLALTFGDRDGPPLANSILRVHGARFAAALERYRSDFDRGLSFTDWTSVVLMQEEGLAAIATFDSGFRGLVEVVDGTS